MLVYSRGNGVSRFIAGHMISDFGFGEEKKEGNVYVSSKGHVRMVGLETELIRSEFLDSEFQEDCFVFLSPHSSSKGIVSFTVHSEGNWNEDTAAGGKPRFLSMASPLRMRSVLMNLSSNNTYGVDVKYEATHHGPALDTPSFFVEIGGPAEIKDIDKLSFIVAKSVNQMLESDASCDSVSLGIGGGHYPIKFTKLALRESVAFSHIMPKYHASEVGMIEQALKRSDVVPKNATIEWKSIKREERESIIGKLEEIGMDYVRV